MKTIQLELDLGLELPPAEEDPGVPVELIVNQNRVVLLQALYARDGRDQSDHPLHGTYSGLAMELHRAIGQALVDRLLEIPRFSPELVIGHVPG